MNKQITFSSNGKHFTVGDRDVFMNNGMQVVFIPSGKYANPTAPRVQIGNKEWLRIMPLLKEIDYEQYYGRKPLMNDVRLYKIK